MNSNSEFRLCLENKYSINIYNYNTRIPLIRISPALSKHLGLVK
jgi:hypothetical protein